MLEHAQALQSTDNMKKDIVIRNRGMRGIAAALLAIVVASLTFLLFGIFLPMLGLRAYYGNDDETDGPGLMVVLIPMGVAVICVAAVCALRQKHPSRRLPVSTRMAMKLQ